MLISPEKKKSTKAASLFRFQNVAQSLWQSARTCSLDWCSCCNDSSTKSISFKGKRYGGSIRVTANGRRQKWFTIPECHFSENKQMISVDNMFLCYFQLTLQSCQFDLITSRPVKANDLRLMSFARVETPELAVTSDWSRFYSHPVQVLFRDRPFAFGLLATSGSGYVTEPLCIRTALASIACKPSHRHTAM